MVLVLAWSPGLLFGQNPSKAPPKPSDGAKLFAQICAGCHGADAHGTNQGPALAGNRALRRRSVPQLRDLIRNGIPAAGMPSFDLRTDQLDALAALVHSLNEPAADTAVPGDVVIGKEFFFGKGQCASCHMVYGRGQPIGPDVSNIARELTLDEIRQSELRPGARITPGYELVTVRLRDGKTIRGFARGRSNFDVRLQDLNGRFHSVQKNEISAVVEEKQSLMQPLTASPEELQN